MVQQRFFALSREIEDLVGLQIRSLRQQFAMNPSQLHDYRARFERIMVLQEELARLRKERILGSAKELSAE